jgi:serine/threonine protein kinase
MPQTFIDNRYALGDLLGSGGMAKVYLAHDEVLARDVALKVLKDQYAHNEEFVKAFRREARSAAALNHPNIVPIYVWGRSEDGTYYMAMEYVPGGTLKDHIRSNGPLDPNTAAELGFQVARALGFAHEHGVIHRDIKSQNILLTETDGAKVADFGIARAAATTTTSQSSLILGTAGYMSPEQAKGEPVGPQSDLYSLGMVLYEMLTGELPYSAEDPVALAMKHVKETPRSTREATPEVPEALDALTLRLLAKNPEDRYPSAAALVDDLERVRFGLPPLVVVTEKKTTGEVATPPLPTEEKLPKETTVQLPAAAPIMEVFEGGRIQRGKLFLALATLLFSVVLLGGLAWILMQY